MLGPGTTILELGIDDSGAQDADSGARNRRFRGLDWRPGAGIKVTELGLPIPEPRMTKRLQLILVGSGASLDPLTFVTEIAFGAFSTPSP